VKRCDTLVLALVVCIFMPWLPARAADQPNIVLFIADDMLWSDAGCYGSADAKTPNLDKLASQGMRFTRCFTSTAMCAPTRQQLYTGVWPVRNGAYPNHSAVKPTTRSLGHHFADLGYRVALSGKKHYKPAKAFPFETLAGGKPHDSGKDAKKDLDIDTIRRFISRDADQSYFLICATNQPHAPWNRGDAAAYDPAQLRLPPYFADTPETRKAYASYLAEVTYMDALLGEVMAAVDQAGQRDHTIFLFTSEQGIGLPFGKWTCYDAGLRTGLVVRWPGRIDPGSTTDAMVQYVDIVPTLIEAAGGEPSGIDTGLEDAPGGGRGFDGESFLRVLLGEDPVFRDVTFGVHTTRGIINGSDCYPIRSVRNKRYKLILNLNHTAAFRNIAQRGAVWDSWLTAAESGDTNAAALVKRYQWRPAVELYDLEQDPYEMNNRADDPTLADERERLRAQLDAWMKQQGDEGVATEMRARPR
jgi:uncharacterized sulfatase